MELLLLLTYTQLTSFHVSSQVIAEHIGKAAPPAVWKGYNMIAFPKDTRGGALYNDAPSPFDGNPVTFSIPVERFDITSWGSGGPLGYSWSHATDASLYYSSGATAVTLTFPEDTGAFIFYIQPNSKTNAYDMTVTYNDGTEFTVNVDGQEGATGFASYGATSATVTCFGKDLTVGEFLMSIVTETTKVPTNGPTDHPSTHPTTYPSTYPTKHPTTYPTKHPTDATNDPTRNPTDSSDELSSDSNDESSMDNALVVDNEEIDNFRYNKTNNNNIKSYYISVNVSQGTAIILLVCGAIFIFNVMMYFLYEKKWKSKTTIYQKGVDSADNEV
eukprot:142377_1